jgi:hypothetical protein
LHELQWAERAPDPAEKHGGDDEQRQPYPPDEKRGQLALREDFRLGSRRHHDPHGKPDHGHAAGEQHALHGHRKQSESEYNFHYRLHGMFRERETPSPQRPPRPGCILGRRTSVAFPAWRPFAPAMSGPCRARHQFFRASAHCRRMFGYSRTALLA